MVVIVDASAMLLAAENQDWRMLDRLLSSINLPQHQSASIFDFFDSSQKIEGDCVDAETGMNPLHWIARHGKLSEAHFIVPLAVIVKQIYEQKGGKASPWVDKSGANPLHHLAYNNFAAADIDVAQELVAEFHRVLELIDQPDLLGATPMHTAAVTANSKLVQALLWIGGDPYALDAFGLSPLDTADQYRNHDISVGLRAVSKREKALAGNLNAYDEEERGVERSEAFGESVACFLEALTERTEEDFSETTSEVSSSSGRARESIEKQNIAILELSMVGSDSEGEEDDHSRGHRYSLNQKDSFNQEESAPPAISVPVHNTDRAVQRASELVDGRLEKMEEDRIAGFDDQQTDALFTDIHALASSLAQLEGKMQFTAERRANVSKRLDATSTSVKKRSSNFSQISSKWTGDALEEEAKKNKEAETNTSKSDGLEEIFAKNMTKGVDWLKESSEKVNGSLTERIGQLNMSGGKDGDHRKEEEEGGWDSFGKRLSQIGLGITELVGESEDFTDSGETRHANSKGEVGANFLTGSEAKLAAKLMETEMMLRHRMNERDERSLMADHDYESHLRRKYERTLSSHRLAQARGEGVWHQQEERLGDADDAEAQRLYQLEQDTLVNRLRQSASSINPSLLQGVMAPPPSAFTWNGLLKTDQTSRNDSSSSSNVDSLFENEVKLNEDLSASWDAIEQLKLVAQASQKVSNERYDKSKSSMSLKEYGVDTKFSLNKDDASLNPLSRNQLKNDDKTSLDIKYDVNKSGLNISEHLHFSPSTSILAARLNLGNTNTQNTAKKASAFTGGGAGLKTSEQVSNQSSKSSTGATDGSAILKRRSSEQVGTSKLSSNASLDNNDKLKFHQPISKDSLSISKNAVKQISKRNSLPISLEDVFDTSSKTFADDLMKKKNKDIGKPGKETKEELAKLEHDEKLKALSDENKALGGAWKQEEGLPSDLTEFDGVNRMSKVMADCFQKAKEELKMADPTGVISNSQRKSLRQKFQNFVKTETEDNKAVEYVSRDGKEIDILVEEADLKLLFRELGWRTLTVAERAKCANVLPKSHEALNKKGAKKKKYGLSMKEKEIQAQLEAAEEELLKSLPPPVKSARFSDFLYLAATKSASEVMLSDEQVGEFIEVFELFMRDKSVGVDKAYMPVKDIVTCMSSLDLRLTPAESDALFNHCQQCWETTDGYPENHGDLRVALRCYARKLKVEADKIEMSKKAKEEADKLVAAKMLKEEEDELRKKKEDEEEEIRQQEMLQKETGVFNLDFMVEKKEKEVTKESSISLEVFKQEQSLQKKKAAEAEKLEKLKKEQEEDLKLENFLIGFEIALAKQKEFQANKQEFRLRSFITNFETGSETTLQHATAILQEKEKQRLAFTAAALSPLSFDEEKREEALFEAERLKRRKEEYEMEKNKKGNLNDSKNDHQNDFLQIPFTFQNDVLKTSSHSFSSFSSFFDGDSSQANENSVAGNGTGSVKGAASQYHRLFPNVDISKVNLNFSDPFSGSTEVATNGGVDPSVSMEQDAREEVMQAQEWAEDMTRDHLMWYLEEFPNNTYEDWIAAFAPENARDYLNGDSSDIDHRFYFENATHLKLWNAAVMTGSEDMRDKYVEPRTFVPDSVKS